jgi:hypothetical protein
LSISSKTLVIVHGLILKKQGGTQVEDPHATYVHYYTKFWPYAVCTSKSNPCKKLFHDGLLIEN